MLAPTTVACVAPKKTALLAAVELKFPPKIVTVVLTGPLKGLKLKIIGGDTISLRINETALVPLLVTAISGLLSAFISPITTPQGFAEVV